jgi:Na+-transporting methylmalonyl-CoA/oxaloacetate decarboxylase gamma subunit
VPPESSFLDACGIAFGAVFGVLTLLAVIMYLITVAFPEIGRAQQPEPLPRPEPDEPDRVADAARGSVANRSGGGG